MASHRVEEALQRLRSEFLDAPSLSVTPGDVARILAVDPPTARVVLHALEDAHFLARARDGRFTSAGPRSPPPDCAVCGQLRADGCLLQVANTDRAEAIWVCAGCQHKLIRGSMTRARRAKRRAEGVSAR